MGIKKNYLPFMRQAKVTFRVADILASGQCRAYTKIADLTTGGSLRAHINDMIITPVTTSQVTLDLKMRIGIQGRSYMTENFYDCKVYEDGNYPTWATWKFRKPYRVYPGERFTIEMGGPGGGSAWGVAGIMFNGVKTLTGEPQMIWGITSETGLDGKADYHLGINDVLLRCPNDSPVDLYSATLNENDPTVTGRVLHIVDGQDRPFCPHRQAEGLIDIKSTPIDLGENWVLDPGETLTVDFETGTAPATTHEYYVTIRGCLEVNDDR